jgi:hypothetical protein
MLVATRDPLPKPGPHDRAPAPPAPPHAASRLGRFMLVLQLTGSMLAIPVGLASGYSIYRANFSPETACRTLRANIVAMIDKQIDASTRRMLVRHDVETFERTCGAFDRDAEAAFKTLLTADGAAAPAPASAKRVEMSAKAGAKAERTKVEQSREVRKSELRAAVPPEPLRDTPKERIKEGGKETARTAAAAPVQPDAMSDARWLEAVRGALVAHETTASTEQRTEKAAARGAPPRSLAVMPAAAPVADAPAAAAAPTLPPPAQISEPPDANAAPAQASDPDRLVPPASIPEQAGSKPTGWLSHVPFVGQALAR